jgi:outer membrane protein
MPHPHIDVRRLGQDPGAGRRVRSCRTPVTPTGQDAGGLDARAIRAVAALGVAAIVGAAGCTTARDLRPVPVPTQPQTEVVIKPTPPPAAPELPNIPPELLKPGATFSLAQVIDVALANSPLTRATYHQARSSSADLKSKRGAYLPQIDATATYGRSRQATIGAATYLTISSYGPAATLNYLLLDFGGRGAKVEEARQNLLAADWSHNARIHDVALGVEQAYFQYMTAKAQLDAAHKTLDQVKTGLDAANVRHDAGVATIADVLQARTAVAQAQLAVDGLEGQVQAVRGALATAMGLPANVPLDIGSLPGQVPLDRSQPAIDTLIADARLSRPDLESLRALAQKAAAHVTTVRSDALPNLALQASASRTHYDTGPFLGNQNVWSARLVLSFPLFHGLSTIYDVKKAQEDAAVAREQANSYEQQVVLQVWTSYYALQTATQRVRTSQALLDSASQSEQVALARYKEGVGTVLDLLSAEAALADARAQEIQARSDWFLALAQLTHDSGRLVPADQIAVVTEEKGK